MSYTRANNWQMKHQDGMVPEHLREQFAAVDEELLISATLLNEATLRHNAAILASIAIRELLRGQES